MKGDDEKCRAAGMSDYLTKPLDRNKLQACLERHLGKLGEGTLDPEVDMNAATAREATAPVDWSAFLKSMDGDESLARELVDLFIESGDETLAAILNALGANDLVAVGEQAHSLKGASANLRATATAQAAARLEAAAKARDLPQIDTATNELRTEVNRTIDYLRNKVAAG